MLARTALLGVALALAGAGPAASLEGVAPRREAPAAAELEQRLDVLLERIERTRRALDPAGGAGAEVPLAAHAAAVAELAERGCDRARAWCLAHPELGGAQADDAELAAQWLDLVERCAGEAFLLEPRFDLLVAAARAPAALREVLAEQLAAPRFAGAESSAVRALALELRARFAQARPGGAGEAAALRARLLEEQPEGPLAARVRDAAWRAEQLAVGAVAPGFSGHDVDGNLLRLADLRGSVVVVDFLDLADLGRGTGGARRALVDRHRDAPVAVLGVVGGTDAQAFRVQRELLGIDWTCVLERPGRDGPSAAWRVGPEALTVVLDAHGVVRFTGEPGPALDHAVAALVAERRARTPARGAGPQTSGPGGTGQ